MPPQLYEPAQVAQRLAHYPAWRAAGGMLEREWVFADFSEAFAFLVRVAIEAEKQDHHPEIANVYNRVTLRLSTHEAGGITDKDFRLAEAIDALAPEPSPVAP